MPVIDQDPPVTHGSEMRVQELNSQWANIRAGLQQIPDNDLRAYNALLNSYGVTNIVAQQACN